MYHYAVLTEKLLPISFLTYSSEENLAIGQLVEVPIRNSLEKGVIFQQSRVDTQNQSSGEVNEPDSLHKSSVDIQNPQNIDNEKYPYLGVKSSDLGVVVPSSKSNTNNSEPEISTLPKYEIKPIANIFPFQFQHENLNFWKSLAFNNFSNLNRVLEAALESLDLLTKADWKILTEKYNNKISAKSSGEVNEPKPQSQELSKNQNNQFVPKLQYLSNKDSEVEGDIDIVLRIMYLIRSVEYKNTLIIFPEIKLLKNWLHRINLKQFSDINVYTFTSGKDKQSKIAIKSLLLENDENSKKKVYFTTRAGLFLPYSKISAIILADESNSMHIQEQGGLYFDSRETVYLLASGFKSDLYYQSNFPSVRFAELSQTTNP
jgi:primosomal protein N'